MGVHECMFNGGFEQCKKFYIYFHDQTRSME